MVERLIVDGTRVTGVELADGTRLGAELVVVAAGALRSPRLLARSGLLDPARPRPVQDHPSVVFTVALRSRFRNDPGERPPISAVLRLDSDATALVMDHVGPGSDGRRHGAVIVQLNDAASRGWLPLDGSEPVRFGPGWLTAASDRARFRAAVRHLTRLLAGPEIRAVASRVLLDDQGTELAQLARWSDDELDRWLLAHPGPVSHVAGTCPMGPDPASGAVVDTTGAVHGHRGVHVVDASVLPLLPAANLQVPVMAVAERLARAIP
jgi:choline dehydrogenase-like flavoprotein